MNVKPLKGFMPKIYIQDEALNKMNEYIDQCHLEIGWLGCAERINDKFIITDVFLFKQEVHSTTTEITTEGLNEFAMELINTREDGMEIWNNMRVWGHSHVNMPTSPSGQDDKQIEVFMENDNDFFIRIIGNKKGDLRIDLYDFKVGVKYEELPYDVIYDEDKEAKIQTISRQIRMLRERLDELLAPNQDLVSEIKGEIALKVSEKKEFTKYVNNYNTGYYGYNYGHYTPSTKVSSTENSAYIEYFKLLNDEEIFEAMMAIEGGITSSEIFVNANFTPYESFKLDELIEDYCNENINEYLNYVDEMYS